MYKRGDGYLLLSFRDEMCYIVKPYELGWVLITAWPLRNRKTTVEAILHHRQHQQAIAVLEDGVDEDAVEEWTL